MHPSLLSPPNLMTHIHLETL